LCSVVASTAVERSLPGECSDRVRGRGWVGWEAREGRGERQEESGSGGEGKEGWRRCRGARGVWGRRAPEKVSAEKASSGMEGRR
jgi:hypothetical protein